MGDTAKTFEPIYFSLQDHRVVNACLFHFFIPSVMSVETDENQTTTYCIVFLYVKIKTCKITDNIPE